MGCRDEKLHRLIEMTLTRFETESKHHPSTQRDWLLRFHRFPIDFWPICQISQPF